MWRLHEVAWMEGGGRGVFSGDADTYASALPVQPYRMKGPSDVVECGGGACGPSGVAEAVESQGE